MAHGNHSEKMVLVKAVLPQMMSAMNTVAQNEQEAAERAAVERMYATMRGEETDVVEDSAPKLRIV